MQSEQSIKHRTEPRNAKQNNKEDETQSDSCLFAKTVRNLEHNATPRTQRERNMQKTKLL